MYVGVFPCINPIARPKSSLATTQTFQSGENSSVTVPIMVGLVEKRCQSTYRDIWAVLLLIDLRHGDAKAYSAAEYVIERSNNKCPDNCSRKLADHLYHLSIS